MSASSAHTDDPEEDEDETQDFGEDWEDEMYQFEASQNHVDVCMKTCYRAIFGFTFLSNFNLLQAHAFIHALEDRRILTLADFYTYFEDVRQLFRQHNFIAEYEALPTDTPGWAPNHVPFDEAVIRLKSLHIAIAKQGVHHVRELILDFIDAHDQPDGLITPINDAWEAVDEEILALLKDFRPYQPLDNISGFFNTPRTYNPDARAHEHGDSSDNKENIDPDSRAHVSALLDQLKTLTV
jgi:hypothetical protein